MSTQQASVGDSCISVLVVEVAGRRCGLLLEDVHEVQPVVTSVPLPDAPAAVEGIIDVRGDVVPVVEFGERLKLAPRAVRLSDRLVIVDVAGRRIALRVDAATDLVDVPVALVHPAETVLPEAVRLAGVARLSDGLLLIHDLAAFLSADEGMALDRALAGVAPGSR